MIVGVAIRNDNMIIMLPKPARHADCFEYATSIGIGIVESGIGVKAKDQGFYTHTGKYLDREQAFRYAKRIKQPLLDDAYKALCSENLW